MLSLRLSSIAQCVLPNKVVADIGTDHGYLPCALVQQGITPVAYACDIAQGPLDSAKKTIAEAKLQNQIKTILMPGLENLPEDVEVVVIAGMGYKTAEMILNQASQRLRKLSQIIVQVNREVEHLREWIKQNQFVIDQEKIVHEYHTYQIVSFHPSDKFACYSEKEIRFGPILMKEKNEVFQTYWARQKNKLIALTKQVTHPEKKAMWLKQIEQINELLEETRN